MNQVFNINNSRVTINPPSQQELNLETISSSITIKLRPSEKEYLEKLAIQRNQPLSAMLRFIIMQYLKIEPQLAQLQKILDGIV